MNVVGRIALAGVGAAGGTAGAVALTKFAGAQDSKTVAVYNQELAQSSKDWSSWEQAVEREFPGGRLDTPDDHARFEAFLAANPAPSWVKVEHADVTKVRTSVGGDATESGRIGIGQGEAYGIGFGGMFVAGGLGYAGAGVAGRIPGRAGAIAALAGPFLAGTGAGMLVASLNTGRTAKEQTDAVPLYDDVRTAFGR